MRRYVFRTGLILLATGYAAIRALAPIDVLGAKRLKTLDGCWIVASSVYLIALNV